MRRFVIGVVAFGLASWVGLAAGQPTPDLGSLKAKSGDTVYVSDASTGVLISGPLSALSADEIAINGHRFRPRPGLKIERAGDPVWEGAAVGFVLGATMIFPVMPETFVDRGGPFRINNGFLWGLVGALIDYQRKGRRTIFDRSAETRRSELSANAATFCNAFKEVSDHPDSKMSERYDC